MKDYWNRSVPANDQQFAPLDFRSVLCDADAQGRLTD